MTDHEEELPPDSARLTLHKNGEIDMELPKTEEGDKEVDAHVIFIAALGVLLQQPGFMEETIERAFPVVH
ncbi:MAG: hypothetical protein M3Q39_01660 [Actinomycetota bacterium]|nr:hypothetical protein [Actinomycetota bacterium]